MQKQILEIAKKLISFQSTKENPDQISACLDYISQELADFSIIKTEKNNSPSLLITNTEDSDLKQHFRYLLNGHIDVVAAEPELFIPRVEEGKLIGRGSIDMKGSVAVMMAVFKKTAPLVDYPLALQIVADEEIGGFNGAKHQIESGVSADLALICEATKLNIEVAAKGMLGLTLTTFGKSSHGAYPWLGKNAINSMIEVLGKIQELFPIPDKESFSATCNFGVIKGGMAHNQVPDLCSCKIDIRRPPEISSEEILEKINSVIKNYDAKIKIELNEPAFSIDTNNPEFLRLKNCIKKHAGKSPKLIKSHGGSDARHFYLSSTPALCFGPTGEGLHSDHEWADIASFETQAKILEEFLLDHK